MIHTFTFKRSTRNKPAVTSSSLIKGGRPGWYKVLRRDYFIASGRFGGAVITSQKWLYTVQPGGLLIMAIHAANLEDMDCPRC
ncbi:hypothetical protein BDV39DRAFT_169703 [Aspergillus sergii]|uniref:Uncharacterized protein n=1 Tax=Aspergillus sergii TaxID=1034303 RepID=A0A5N6XHE5_9EURO|nr:hypothetical protein BDV39DRAFT_169703 [Aspergillus sergii]